MKDLKDYLHFYLDCEIIINYDGKDIIEKLESIDIKSFPLNVQVSSFKTL